MPPERRRGVPDNLDPLVDTLSNVVGILVVVVALTQIQLGDALERVSEIEARGQSEQTEHKLASDELRSAVEIKRSILEERLAGGAAFSIEQAIAARDAISALPRDAAADINELDTGALQALDAKLERSKGKLLTAKAVYAQRGTYAAQLQSVPDRQVARIPDPQEILGRESWILVRYGRVYLVDREKLFEEARRAINRLLPHAGQRAIRLDEFEAVARYLRKQDVGFGKFRWQMQTDPDIRVELTWRSPDGGLERTRLATDPALAAWLRVRDPEIDAIQFIVWSDSFETYLEARKQVERAGFRAGWRGVEADVEFDLGLRIGPLPPDVRPLNVD